MFRIPEKLLTVDIRFSKRRELQLLFAVAESMRKLLTPILLFMTAALATLTLAGGGHQFSTTSKPVSAAPLDQTVSANIETATFGLG